ncbi:MAG: type IX secretion system membrane protein PorP/SprF [Bacteroidota bacterium]
MRTHCYIYLPFIVLLVLLTGTHQGLRGQVVPLTLQRAYAPWLFNPATYGTTDYHRLDLMHQNHLIPGLGDVGISTQRLNYVSPRTGKRRNFGWGFTGYFDTEHTETRLMIRPGMAVRLLETPALRVSTGISIGLVSLNGSYQGKVPVGRPGDPVLSQESRFVYPDLSAGLEFLYQVPAVRVDGHLMVGEFAPAVLGNGSLQLPNPATTDNNPFLEGDAPLVPSLIAAGGIQFGAGENILIGPRGFYYQPFSLYPSGNDSVQPVVDVGMRADFRQQRFWLSGGYRLNAESVRLGFGMQFGEARIDTLTNSSHTAWGFNLGFTHQIGMNNSFGSQVEAGLFLMLPSRKNQITVIDTVLDFGSFWKTNGQMDKHMDLYMAHLCPKGLRAETDTLSYEDKIVLQYSFPDPYLDYLGESPRFFRDSLLKSIGAEWPGVDNFLEKLTTDVINHALHPDTTLYKETKELDSLKYFIGIEITTNLRTDDVGMNLGISREKRYRGDLLHQNGRRADSVLVLVTLDELDTTIVIHPHATGEVMTELELACLKLYAMRKKLEYELRKYYNGTPIEVAWEESARSPLNPLQDYFVHEHRRVFISKLRINTGNQYQKADQAHHFDLYFLRHGYDGRRRENFLDDPETQDDSWIPREEIDGRQQAVKKPTKKEKKASKKDKKPKKSRAAYDPWE